MGILVLCTPLEKKGQVSFEILLITMIVFVIAIWVSSYYFTIKDSTLAMQLLKVHALREVGEAKGLYTIEKISFEENGDKITLTLQSCPNAIPNFDSAAVKRIIRNNTRYSDVSIRLAKGSC